MKKINLLLIFAAALTFGSCIKKEAKNMEADILECIIPAEYIKVPPTLVDNAITLHTFVNVDVTKLAPEFVLTPGATLSPASGTARDFTRPQEYVVTSEDGIWKKIYTVSVTKSSAPTEYDCDTWRTHTAGSYKYNIMYEQILQENGEFFDMDMWGSGNAGFQLSIPSGKTPDTFPTCATEESVSGFAAKLETKATGFLGGAARYMAAGNLFIGRFELTSITGDHLTATKFGYLQPGDRYPAKFTGYYRYKAGPKYYIAKNKVEEGRIDSCKMYAVLYENEGGEFMLDGRNVLTHENIVATAIVKDPQQTLDEDGNILSEYTYFEAEFDYLLDSNGKQKFNVETLKNSGYNFSIVLSSSYLGDEFKGALGSTLYIDELKIISEQVLE